MASRIMRNAHTRIGWTQTSETTRAKMRPAKMLSTYAAHSPHGGSEPDLSGITVESDGATHVIFLTDTAAIELVKGVLANVLEHRGGPISMASDEEFRSILQQCQKAIKLQDEDAEQVVAAVRRNDPAKAAEGAIEAKYSMPGEKAADTVDRTAKGQPYFFRDEPTFEDEARPADGTTDQF